MDSHPGSVIIVAPFQSNTPAKKYHTLTEAAGEIYESIFGSMKSIAGEVEKTVGGEQ